MDALAQLALMTKAKAVFESTDTFLSFPALSPLSYPPERLKFVKPGGMTVESLADQSEFARVTNQVPRGVLAPVDESEYLWDVYRDVLDTGQAARGALTPDEQDQLEKAIAFLYTNSPEGLRQDSDAVRTYKQYRDANFEAQEEFKNQQLTAETSDDAAVKAKWTSEDEPALRDELERLQNEWLTQGFKTAVEAAQQAEQAFASREPSLTWTGWQESFIKDIDLATDTNQINFASTGFSPYDLFDIGSWPQFTLTRTEISALIEQAPEELKTIFGSDLGASDIDSVSFEYRSVALTRPWFRPAIFKARFWRLPAGADELSDGHDLAKGRCPAYAAALVFVRNVAVRLRAQPTESGVVRDHRTLLQLNPAVLNPDVALRMHAVAMNAGAPVATSLTTVRDHRTATVPVAPAIRDHRLDLAVFAARPQISVLTRLGGTRTVLAAPPASDPAPTIPPPAPPPTSEVSILAFICKRVPLCPDPDPSLPWA